MKNTNFTKKKSKFSNMNLNIFKTNRLMHTYTQQAFKSHLSNICLTLLLRLVVVPRCNSSLRFARCIPSRTNFSILVALGFPVVVPRNGFPRPRRAGPSSKFCVSMFLCPVVYPSCGASSFPVVPKERALLRSLARCCFPV